MARPVEFEHDVVINKAMEQFWREGFEASSIQKLLDVTNINRGTLYNSFGDKDAFFKSCVDKYNEGLQEVLNQTLLNKELKPLPALTSFFEETFTGVTNKQRVLGCLLVNSVCESINWNASIQKLLRKSLKTTQKAFLSRTRELEKLNKLKKGVSAELAADLLMTTLKGLRVDSREGKSTKQLMDTAKFTLTAVAK